MTDSSLSHSGKPIKVRRLSEIKVPAIGVCKYLLTDGYGGVMWKETHVRLRIRTANSGLRFVTFNGYEYPLDWVKTALQTGKWPRDAMGVKKTKSRAKPASELKRPRKLKLTPKGRA
jgi:hypothetical protein